jgi:hypothetical protein
MQSFPDEKGQVARTPGKDKWELCNIDEDWSQANDLPGSSSDERDNYQ